MNKLQAIDELRMYCDGPESFFTEASQKIDILVIIVLTIAGTSCA